MDLGNHRSRSGTGRLVCWGPRLTKSRTQLRDWTKTTNSVSYSVNRGIDVTRQLGVRSPGTATVAFANLLCLMGSPVCLICKMERLGLMHPSLPRCKRLWPEAAAHRWALESFREDTRPDSIQCSAPGGRPSHKQRQRTPHGTLAWNIFITKPPSSLWRGRGGRGGRKERRDSPEWARMRADAVKDCFQQNSCFPKYIFWTLRVK